MTAPSPLATDSTNPLANTQEEQKTAGKISPDDNKAAPENPAPQTNANLETKPDVKAENKIEQTYGEKKFHNRYYGTVGFWANLSLSSLITYFVNDTKNGSTVKDLLYKGFYQNTLRIPHHGMRDILTKATTLLMGGHITAIAIYLAEKTKAKQVRQWDEEYYGPNAEADPAIKAAHERIDNESKVNVFGMAISRVICWATIQLVAAVGGNKEQNLIKGYAEKKGVKNSEFISVERPSQWIGTKIAHYTPGFIKKPATSILGLMADKDKKQEVYQKVMEYAAMDTIYTALTAWMLKPLNQSLSDNIPFLRKSPPNQKKEEKSHAMTAGYIRTSDTTDIPDNKALASSQQTDKTPHKLTQQREYIAPMQPAHAMTMPAESRTT